ncbi:MAG: EpsG family protein [Proteus vulgaris]
MASVIFYNFILFSSTFFVWLSDKGKGHLERSFFLSIAFLLVFIPAAIRYDVGTDYLNYLRLFENYRELENYKYKEPLFYFVNWFYLSIGAHYQWMFATFAFIFTVVAFKTYRRKHAWLLHFLFFSMLWFFSFNGMRQAVALSWCLLALFYFFERRYFCFFTFTLIGMFFHQSALLILISGLVALIPLSNRVKYRLVPIFFIGFIVFTYISMNSVLNYIEQSLSLIGLTKYAGYFSSSKHFLSRNFGSGIGVLVKVFFSVYVIFNTKIFLQKNKNYWLLIILTFIYSVGVVLANNIVIFGRMADTFVIAPIVAGFLLFQFHRMRRFNRLVLGCFLFFLILTFVKVSVGVITEYGNPKLNPYMTIF